MSKALTDIMISTFLTVLLMVFGIQCYKVPQEARVYPLVLLIMSACLVVISFVINIRKYKEESKIKEATSNISAKKTILIYIVFIGAYIMLMDKIGYSISTYLFTLLSLLYLKVESKKVLIILPIGITLIIYFVFTNILYVMLPRGTWMPF